MTQTEAAPATRRRQFGLVGVVVVAAAAVAYLVGAFGTSDPEGVLTLSGRIEGDEAAIGPKTGGLILDVYVREGDRVAPGDAVAAIDDKQVNARVEQAQAALAQAEARANSAQNRIAVLEQQLHQAELQTVQAGMDAEGRVHQAEADLAMAEAQLARETAAYEMALFDKEAYSRLAETGAVSRRQGREAVSAANQQAAAVTAAERRVEAARAGLATAEAYRTNPEIRAAETAALHQQIMQQEAEVESARAQIQHVRAQVAEAEANRADLTVRAPFGGTVVTRAAEPGEIVGPGTPVVTLVDLDRVYLRGFVPEGRIGEIRVGQPARVYLDSSPERAIAGVVTRIDPEATFTPENTYFRDDRVKQVVGVKIALDGAAGFAKPGMPADGEILVGAQWADGARPSAGPP